MKGQRYRFSVVVNELKHLEIMPYISSCVAFVNAIILATDNFQQRVKVRNEFIGKCNRHEHYKLTLVLYSVSMTIRPLFSFNNITIKK